MINEWLAYEAKVPCPSCFTLIEVSEKCTVDTDIKSYIGQHILKAYRDLDFLKLSFEHEPEESLKHYLNSHVLPTGRNQISKNVSQGDFGEIVAELIVSFFCKLTVPISKLKWKFNNDRSVFCTDMIAHGSGDKIMDVHYFEIKTRLQIRKEQLDEENNYVTVNAHNSLLKDEQAPSEGIADFLSRLYYDQKNYELFLKYQQMVKNPQNHNRRFELFFIVEKAKYISAIVDDLESLPPVLRPLNVTIVLIEQLGRLIIETRNIAISEAVKYVYSRSI